MVDTLNRLAATIAARRGADAGSSYTASLFAKGLPKIAQFLRGGGVFRLPARNCGSGDCQSQNQWIDTAHKNYISR